MDAPEQADVALPSLVLDYHQTVAPPRRTIWSVIAAFLALPALASIALTFTWNDSPLSVELDYLRQVAAGDISNEWALGFLAAPFFLAIPIFAWRVRFLISQSMTRTERVLARTSAILGAATTIVIEVFLLMEAPRNITAALASGVPAIVLVVGAVLSYRRRGRAGTPLLELMTAYSANAMLALLAFPESPDVGWYATLAAVILHALQVGRALFRHADL